MPRIFRVLFTLALAAVVCQWALRSFAADAPENIDWDRARQLLQKERAGQALTDDERKFLDHAKEVRRQTDQARQPRPPAPTALTPRESVGLKPLTEMTADDRHKGQDGGLYGAGSNVPPKELADAAKKELARIVPLDAEGKPAADGKIVLLSMGMSNTTQEFSKFKELADKDADKSAQLVIVDGAQGGKDAAAWVAPRASDQVWQEVERRLKAAGVTGQQVQIVWLKQALIQQGRFGEFPEHAKKLKELIIADLNLARTKFPNLKVAFLSSRIYGGYASGALNPEPYAYEGSYAVRWVIQDQMKGEKTLNWDADKGEVKCPLLLWGPYLWADGTTPRKADGLVYKREDLAGDGTHPSGTTGRQKVAEQLLKFFKADPNAKAWFLKPAPAT